MSKGRKILIALIAVLLILTAGVYGYGVYYFTGHFLPGSFVNGFNCSYMDQAETEDLLSRKTDAYVLAVQTRGNGQESISADEIDLKYVSDGSVKQLMHDQSRFLWFLSFGQEKNYETPSSVTYDEAKFSEVLDSLDCMKGDVAPEDAYLQETDEGYEIVPEVVGNTVDRDKLTACISKAVTTGKETVNLDTDDCYVNPKSYADDERMIKDCEQLNALTDAVITYDFDDRWETLDREGIRGLLSRDENGDLYLDKDLIADYIKELAAKYDTVGNTRTFLTYNDQEVEVSGGDFGWVIDQEKETDALYNAITDQKTQVREPVYKQEGLSRAENDIGLTYVEISLSAMRLVLYVDGHPTVDTAISAVSGMNKGVYYAEELKVSDSKVWSGEGVIKAETFESAEGVEDDFVSEDTFDSGSEESTADSAESSLDAGSRTLDIPADASSALYAGITENMPLVVY